MHFRLYQHKQHDTMISVLMRTGCFCLMLNKVSIIVVKYMNCQPSGEVLAADTKWSAALTSGWNITAVVIRQHGCVWCISRKHNHSVCSVWTLRDRSWHLLRGETRSSSADTENLLLLTASYLLIRSLQPEPSCRKVTSTTFSTSVEEEIPPRSWHFYPSHGRAICCC